jgi:thiamine kinase-like enzyme
VSDTEDVGLDPVVLERVNVLAGRSCLVEPLPGGLTNKNYKVTTTEGVYVVRQASPSPANGLGVDRQAEYENSVRAAAAGVGAPVIDFLPEIGILVVGFLEGETVNDAHLQRPGMLPRIAEACRRLHAGPSFVNRFDMFELQPDYLGRVMRGGFRLPSGYHDHTETVGRIRTALAVQPTALVPCNNDLLAANFIDDGGAVSIIDYEYSGNNDPYFELGNLWSECHLSDDQLEELVVAYDGTTSRSHLARARLWAVMSQYGWTLWASIQDSTSTIDFDFWTWGMEKYERADATFGHPDLERLLADVTRAD